VTALDNEEKSRNKHEFLECNFDGFDETISRLKENGAEFVSLSTVRNDKGNLSLIYYFQVKEKIIVLKAKIKDNSIPSLYSSFVKADFVEREINNTFGIKFLGHPNLERIQGADTGVTEESFFKKRHE
jgi:NADH:ubiquinone oxidoreductase subunit C